MGQDQEDRTRGADTMASTGTRTRRPAPEVVILAKVVDIVDTRRAEPIY